MKSQLTAASVPMEGAIPPNTARGVRRDRARRSLHSGMSAHAKPDTKSPHLESLAGRPALRHRALTVLTVLVLCTAFCSFLFSLERVPEPQPDEVFFNYPAVRHLDGHGLTWKVSPTAPHGDRIWAYHGPFFPRLQTVTLRLLGVNHFAFRLPEYVAGHAALWLLCGFLLRRRHAAAALIVATAWLGDISLRSLLNGRMDGIAFFFVALGFLGLCKALSSSRHRRARAAWTAAASASLGIACGFHPVCVYFVGAGAVAAIILTTKGARLATLSAYAAGLILPIGLVALCWMDNFPGAIEQFLWFANRWRPTEGPLSSSTREAVTRAAAWSVWWVGSLAAASCLIGLISITTRAQRNQAGEMREQDLLWRIAALFSLAGLVVFGRIPGATYYYLYFTVWPTLTIVLALQSGGLSLWRSRLLKGALVLLAMAWVPSMAGSAAFFRSMLIFHDRLDPTHLVHAMKRAVPTNAEVTGSPMLVVGARHAGLRFTPLPWAGRNLAVSPDVWLALTEADWKRGHRIDRQSIANRRVVYRANPFPNTAPYMDFPIVILAPEVPKGNAILAGTEGSP